MHRCFVEPGGWKSSSVSLGPEEHHHLTKVMRAVNGDVVSVFDGQGREAKARVDAISNSCTTLSILSDETTPGPDVSIFLIQALPKGKRMELIIEKATELGVSVIIPVISERVVMRPDKRRGAEKQKRWQRIALSATRQCGSRWIPEVLPPCSLSEALRSAGPIDLSLMAHLGTGTLPLREVIERERVNDPKRIAFLVGPEGDWSENEVKIAVDSGAQSVGLGNRVLRVETAAIFGVSVLAYSLLEETSG